MKSSNNNLFKLLQTLSLFYSKHYCEHHKNGCDAIWVLVQMHKIVDIHINVDEYGDQEDVSIVEYFIAIYV